MNLFFAFTILSLLLNTYVATATSGTVAVVNKTDGTLSVIDSSNGRTKILTAGFLPHEVVMDEKNAYVSNYGSAHIRSSNLNDRPGNTISKIDLTPPYRTSTIVLGSTRCAPHGMVLSQDSRRLYVTCEGHLEIAVVDTVTLAVTHFLPTNQAGSHLLVLAPDESRLYVSNFWLGTVSVINVREHTIEKQISFGRGCEGIGLSKDGRDLFVTRVEDREVIKIDTHTLEITKRILLPEGSSPIRVTPGSDTQLLVNDVKRGKLLILNPQDLSLAHEVKVGNQPIGLAVSYGKQAFVANMRDKTVSVINLKSFAVESEFPTGNAPDGVSFKH